MQTASRNAKSSLSFSNSERHTAAYRACVKCACTAPRRAATLSARAAAVMDALNRSVNLRSHIRRIASIYSHGRDISMLLSSVPTLSQNTGQPEVAGQILGGRKHAVSSYARRLIRC